MAEVAWAKGLRVATVDPRSLSADQLRQLHNFSRSVLEEPFESFERSALWHDVVYIFKRQADGEVIGISFWRHTDLKVRDGDTIKVIVQGKLRILAQYRRLGLHVWANLWYWYSLQRRFPWKRIWLISIASLFNYVSMRKSISDFHLIGGDYSRGRKEDLQALHVYLKELVAMDKFEFDPENPCRINVHIKIDEKTLKEFPSSFYNMPEALEYTKVNPKFADGYDLSYAFMYSMRNVLGMLWRGVVQTYIRSGVKSSKTE